MDPILVTLLVLGASVAVVAGLSAVPFETWTFPWRGRRIQVRNHLFTETVRVDGRAMVTRRSGNLTWGEHSLPLDGETLRIWVGSNGAVVSCRVDDGTQVVFQSQDLPPPLALASPVAAEPDPRLAAARVLLDAVGQVDRAAATDLERALMQLLADQAAAREAVDAHLALGGTEAEVGILLQRRTRAVEELMDTLRALHLRVTGAPGQDDPGPALREARQALARLDAAREVDAAMGTGATLRQAMRRPVA